MGCDVGTVTVLLPAAGSPLVCLGQRMHRLGPLWDRCYFSTWSLIGEEERCRGVILHFSKTLAKSGRLCVVFRGQTILSVFKYSVSGF